MTQVAQGSPLGKILKRVQKSPTQARRESEDSRSRSPEEESPYRIGRRKSSKAELLKVRLGQMVAEANERKLSKDKEVVKT